MIAPEALAIWNATTALTAGSIAGRAVAKLSGVPFGKLPPLPCLAEHPGLLMPELPGLWPALVAAGLDVAGEIIGLMVYPLAGAAWPCPMAVGRIIGEMRGAVVPLTPANAAGSVIVATGLRRGLVLAGRRGHDQVLMVPDLGQLGMVALPQSVRRALIDLPDDDPTFCAGWFVEKAVRGLRRHGRDVVVPDIAGA